MKLLSEIGLAAVEALFALVKEVFDLQCDVDVRDIEKKYLT